MAVYMGLDIGEKRVGIALTDEAATMAIPHETLTYSSRKQLLESLRNIIRDYRVERIVVGFPKTLKDEIGPAAENMLKVFEWLKSEIENDWHLYDERLTTAEVERVLLDADVSRAKRKEVRDQLAAQRILQSFLDREKNQ